MLKLMHTLSGEVHTYLDIIYRPDRVLRTWPKVKIKIDFTDKESV